MGKANRRFSDPCKLTPFEQRVWDLMKEGKKPKQIAEILNLASSSSIGSAAKSAKEKIAAQQYDEAIYG